MTLGQVWLNKGKAEGKAEGKVEGNAEGRIDGLIEMFNDGELSAEQVRVKLLALVSRRIATKEAVDKALQQLPH